MSDTQRPTAVSVDAKVEVQQPNTALQPDSGNARRLQTLHPKYEPYNPIAFRSKFLNDATFRNQYIDDVLQYSSQDEGFQAMLAEDPEAYNRIRANFQDDSLQSLYKDVSTGQDISEAISGRAGDLAGTQALPFKVDNAVTAVLSFPDSYKDYGLTDGKQPLGTMKDPGLLQKVIQSDPNLKNQIYQDRYRLFIADLGKAHNVTGVNLSNVDDVAQAFAIYENYGPEALTRYINYSQKYNPDVALADQDAEVQASYRFFNSADGTGRTPKDVVKDFIGSQDSEYGRLTYQPKAESLEMGMDVPLDANSYTQYFHPQLKQSKQKDFFNMVGVPTVRDGVAIPKYNDDKIDKVLSSIDNNIPTTDYEDFTWDLMTAAREGRGLTMNDLLQTLTANAEDAVAGERGDLRYLVDPNQLSGYAKAAFDAVSLDVQGSGRSLSPAENGKIWVEPGRQQRLQNQGADGAFYRYVNRSRVPVYNEKNELTGFDEQFDPKFWSNDHPALMLGRSAQFFNDYLFTPLAEVTAGIANAVGADEVAESITTSDFMRKLRENADFNAYSEASSFVSGGGATLMAADMGMYLLSALNIGNMAVRTGTTIAANAARAASGAYKTRNASLAARYLQSPTFMTRVQAQALKTEKILQNSRLGPAFLNIELGAAALESAGQGRRSMLANPVFDTLMDKVGVQTDIEKTYAMSNNMARMGLDIMASIGFGIGIDTLWGGMKFGGNLIKASKGKQVRGLALDDTLQDYAKTSNAVFAPEWRRLAYNLTNGLQDMPLGQLAESQANLFAGKNLLRNPEGIETISDAMAIMNREYGQFFGGLREDIESSVRYWDSEFGGDLRYTDEQMGQRVDELFNESVDKIADGLVTTFNNTQNPTKIDLVRTMAEAMIQSGRQIDVVPWPDENGGLKVLMSEAEANALSSRTPHTFVTPAQQPNGQTLYTVNKIDDGFWGYSLGTAMLKRYNKKTADDVVNRYMAKNQIDADSMNKQQRAEVKALTTRAEAYMGEEVLHNNKRAFVVDVENDGYRIQYLDGTVLSGVQLRSNQGMLEVDEKLLRPEMSQGIARVLEQPLTPGTPSTQPRVALLGFDEEAYTNRILRENLRGRIGSEAILRDLEAGAPVDGVLAKMREAGFDEQEIRTMINSRYDEQIQSLQTRADAIQRDKRIKDEGKRAERVAEVQNELDTTTQLRDRNSDRVVSAFRKESDRVDATNNAVAKEVENVTSDTPVRTLTGWWRDAQKKAVDAANKSRVVSGSKARIIEPGGPDPVRQTLGIGSRMFNQLSNFSPIPLTATIKTTQNVILGLGTDNNLIDNITKIAYNKGKIRPFEPEKGLKKHTLGIHNGELYMTRMNVDADLVDAGVVPSVWIRDLDGSLTYNPLFARTETNKTVNPITGQLTPYTRVGRGTYGPVFRPAVAGDPIDSQVFLNIQKPTNRNPENVEQILSNHIDGIVYPRREGNYYEVFNEADQAIAVTRVAEFDPTMNNRRKDLVKVERCT
jgi:hypothetical protein